MGRGKDLSEQEKNLIIKSTAKKKPQAEIAAQIGRHVKTIKRFLENPKIRKERKDKGKLRKLSERDVRRLKATLKKNPGSTSKDIFPLPGLQMCLNRPAIQFLENLLNKKKPL